MVTTEVSYSMSVSTRQMVLVLILQWQGQLRKGFLNRPSRWDTTLDRKFKFCQTGCFY
jgi:hypothetical protein